MKPTLVELFAGGGLAGVGYAAAGFEPVGAVEYDPDIAAVYAANLGAHIVVGDVSSVDYTRWAGAALLHVSPPCTNASVANQGAGESSTDLANADTVCRALREIGPRWFVLENVAPYRKFASFERIVSTLKELGYAVSIQVCNSADWGVPQTRKRLFLRASQDGRLKALTPTHCRGGKRDWSGNWLLKPWVGWYAAIEDLIPTLPAGKLADWQLKRMPEWLTTCLVPGVLSGCDILRTRDEPSSSLVSSSKTATPKAILVDSAGYADETGAKQPVIREAGEPVNTVLSNLERRSLSAVLVDGGNVNRPEPTLRAQDEPALPVVVAEGRAPLRGVFISGEWDGPQREGRALRAFVEDEPSSAVMSSTHKRQPCALLCQLQPNARGAWRPGDDPAKSVLAQDANHQRVAVLVGNQQGADGEHGRQPQLCARDEQAHPVTASQHAKGKLPVGVLLDGGNTSRQPTMLDDDEPSMTVQAWHGRRPSQAPSRMLGAARVVTITPRCLARFQSVPDSYELPVKASLACRVIGNGVACKMAEVIGREFLKGAR